MGIWQIVLLIGTGGALGALLRWGLGLWLNPLFAMFAFGTLIANYLGCLLIGILMSLIWQFPHISQEWRLFLITGFLGSLTTFSAFSAEVMDKWLNGQWINGLSVIGLHLLGGLCFTALGVMLGRWLSGYW